jgi:hypothetical protein
MSIDLFDKDIVGGQEKPLMRFTLWRFFDKDDHLLYVTKNVNQNVMKSKEWWYDAVRCEIEHYASAGEVEDAKFCAIQDEAPQFNVHNTPKD